jgi:hypothetical protein
MKVRIEPSSKESSARSQARSFRIGQVTRTSEIMARMNERDYPHLVELPLPFRTKSEDILAFHRERGVQIRRGRRRNDEGQFYVTFCFAEPSHADAFRDRFGGERLMSQKRRRFQKGGAPRGG